MPHIDLPDRAPGIVGLLAAYPEAGLCLTGLAEALLRGPSSITPAEREVIAAYVSKLNGCVFCMNSHGAAARCLLGPEGAIADEVMADSETADIKSALIGEKLEALLAIAGKVQQGGRSVSETDIARARAAGADDKAIHDTVLIAAAFCMYNRYVDGLATVAPQDQAAYSTMGERLAREGYVQRSK